MGVLVTNERPMGSEALSSVFSDQYGSNLPIKLGSSQAASAPEATWAVAPACESRRSEEDLQIIHQQISILGICWSAMSLSISPHTAAASISPHTAAASISPYTAPAAPAPISPYTASPPMLLLNIRIIGAGRTVMLGPQVIAVTQLLFGSIGAHCLRKADSSRSYYYRRPFAQAGQERSSGQDFFIQFVLFLVIHLAPPAGTAIESSEQKWDTGTPRRTGKYI
jgi:hypothetical protein